MGRFRAVALWVEGDGEGETLLVRILRLGRPCYKLAPVDELQGMATVRLSQRGIAGGLQLVEDRQCDLPAPRASSGTSAKVRLADFRALPALHPAAMLSHPAVLVNGHVVRFPVRLGAGQA